ncbi:PREDICTED: uncharacterized protein LOC108684604 isoform X2 [Atta colombica]|uniref:uncharacterized protein LOC108684604 isoform X2 n=1 Tax=Atta colombica TaxID=520822 RepID=UPI00084C5134|nr:PREDICTED: uncharacterized protein LOC108684604 isoform X2 [Atta colombica]
MEMMNDDKSDRIKQDHIQNIMKEIIPSIKNQSNGINGCTKNADENEHYELAEAKNSVKYIKHFVTKMKPIIDQNAAKPKDYDKWTEEEQIKHIIDNIKTYMPSIPQSLLFFISGTLYRGDCGRNSMDKPLWLDMEKFQRGQKFVLDYFVSISFANIISLFQIFAFTGALKPLIFSQKSHTPYLAFKRYLSTICYIKSWMTEDPWTVGTRAYNDIQTVRRMHRAIRLKLCEKDTEEIEMASKIPNPWCPNREIISEDLSSCPYPTIENGCINVLIKLTGLNQADMAATQFAFIGMILLYPQEFGIYVSDEDMAAFCHTWRGLGYLLGIEDQYNFCRGSLKEIKQRSRDFIEVWTKSYLRQALPEWEHMLRCVIEDMPRMRSTLTYYERFKLIISQYFMSYIIRIRFIREFLTKKFYEKMDEAIKYRPKKHMEFKKRSQKTLAEGL